MAHIHIAATPGVTIDGFRAVAAKHNPPQDIDGLLAWAAGDGRERAPRGDRVAVQGAPGPVGRRAALPRVPVARHDRCGVEHGVHRVRRGRTVHSLSSGPDGASHPGIEQRRFPGRRRIRRPGIPPGHHPARDGPALHQERANRASEPPGSFSEAVCGRPPLVWAGVVRAGQRPG